MKEQFLKNLIYFFFFVLLSCNDFFSTMSQPVLSLESMEKAREAGARAWKELVTTPTNFHLEASCWETALQKFKVFSGNCGGSNESVKIILALVLTECHMRPRLVSFPTYTCRLDDLFSNDKTSKSHVSFSVNAWKETWSKPCLSALSETAFSVYVQFFNHIDNICFYLQSTAWQEKTEETVILLSETSHKVVTQLHQAKIQNDFLLEKQAQALEFQKDLSERSEQLRKALDVGHSSLQASLAGMHEQIYNEQQKLLSGFKDLTKLFQRVLRFQQYVTNWLFGAQGVSIYVLLIILTYYMTTALSTRSCRGKLYALWTIMFCLEILTYRWSQFFFSNSKDFVIKAIGSHELVLYMVEIL
ncbi:uncharacterized protein LOC128884209 isoform X2 [Hylaeus volcanicus]|uniref:uncharacterized protein LOC128884209 isoform X2 n=1 Tax=Hylaeus volcanicus TaxID=313075 RepID=UPI0023B77548|nr:uncharacterized protein LOC128884209 isoform X2 [Hylaeus volcanicus]XP_053993394.1 uncharacterized protein LOC128884209 isoform X2 [Hylaeus volcanicus]